MHACHRYPVDFNSGTYECGINMFPNKNQVLGCPNSEKGQDAGLGLSGMHGYVSTAKCLVQGTCLSRLYPDTGYRYLNAT